MLRIYLSDDHDYPARIGGLGSRRVSDLLAKGLAELGHEVDYHLKGEVHGRLPPGVRRASEKRSTYDILHLQDAPLSPPVEERAEPWVRGFHAERGLHVVAEALRPHLIYVSATHASRFGSRRYVHNGVDPGEFLYSEAKDEYFVFLVSGLERAEIKGIDVAFGLVRDLGIELVVAGSSRDAAVQARFARRCRDRGVRFVGEVHGARKAELLAGARALLFPTRMDEPFGLVAIEALVSGTPVICSDRGACRELIGEDVGIVCRCAEDYRRAVEEVGRISPRRCRERALSAFHYRTMARSYVKEYQRQIDASR